MKPPAYAAAPCALRKSLSSSNPPSLFFVLSSLAPMKFQLTISDQYVSDWDVWEGVRETIQNALDARDKGHPMHINYNQTDGMLIVANFGVKLDRSVWLMGVTSKADDADARGHFGEGLKLGALALVRAGRKLQIVNHGENWDCTLAESKAFPGQQVLTVNTRRRSSPVLHHCFSVRIEITPAEWEDFRLRFIDLQQELAAIDTSEGLILTDEQQRGRLYVKGIHVETRDNLAAGYNLTGSVRTDRDRRMVNSFDLDYHIGHAWIDALCRGGASPARLLVHLQSGCDDAKGVADRHCPEQQMELVAQAWRDSYGANTIPVKDHSGVNDASHFGKIGRITTPEVVAFFQDYPELSLEKLRSERRGDVVETYTSLELNPFELHNLQLALSLIEPSAADLGLTPIAQRLRVVDFRDDSILGTHSFDQKSKTFRINIARKNLDSLEATIRVIVHEAAHDCGDDGSAQHEHAEAKLFSRIITEQALLPQLTPA
jgi:hypothetical protein